ncbi:hypothetical protein SteCoe_17078 [Stentor coeruleus]|uniref:Protein kinase domain-containing protein n=1 Tax=Stentor coeruleus TaxID=5963 RepID=A0A1R2BZP7_9CILI|nr:hypothetical protein SteCoe_17078 [Stentor coeruleus]
MEITVPPGKTKFYCSGTQYIVDDRYEFIKELGPRSFGDLALANDKILNKKVVIKKVACIFNDLHHAKQSLKEIRLLQFFNHENLLSLLNIEIHQRNNYHDLYITTDFQETNLYKIIKSSQNLSNEHFQYIIYQALRGLHKMHSSKVFHRDLKPTCLLLNQDCSLKICSLGLARKCSPTPENLTDYVGTRWYRPPEQLLTSSKYDEKFDIWSLGCIFAEMIGEVPLFPGDNYIDQITKIIKILGTPKDDDLHYVNNDAGVRFIRNLPKENKKNWRNILPRITDEGIELLDMMLVFDPNKRASALDCMRSSYFRDYYSEEDCLIGEAFDWSYDEFVLNRENIEKYFYEEAKKFLKNGNGMY